MILVDSSVWVEVFRRDQPLDLEALLPFNQIITTPPIVQEVLQGFRKDADYRDAREAMWSLPCLDNPMPSARFEAAAELFRTCRRRGFTVRSSVDCLLAAVAIHNEVGLLHRDRDFTMLAQVSSLRAWKLRTPQAAIET